MRLSTDRLLGVFTDKFHVLGKKGFMGVMSPFVKDIKESTNEIYDDDLKSKNGKLFKSILEDLISVDQDTGESSGRILGMTRKGLYYLMAKFLVVLYDVDSYYAERIDFVVMRLMEQQYEIYLHSETCDPKNWYPNRTQGTYRRYIASRIVGKDVINTDHIVIPTQKFLHS